MPKDKPVVVSCVYGFQVSREAVAELRAAALTPGRSAAASPPGTPWAAPPFRSLHLKRRSP